MGKRVLTVDSLIGGEGEDKKVGVTDGFYRSQSIDFRKRPSRWELLPGTVKESGSVVDTAVQDMVRVDDGTLFLMGGTKIYRRTKEAQGGNGTYTEIIDSADGLTNADSAVYNRDRSKIYIPDGKVIHAIDDPDSATTDSDFNDSLIGEVLDYEVSSGALNTYAVPTSISEADADKIEWQPEAEPLSSIEVIVVARGSADLTLTVHDAADNEVASVTVLNADLPASPAYHKFTFALPSRLYVKPNARTYHVHVTASTSGATIRVDTTNDLSTAKIRTYADRLVDDVHHPIMQYLQYMVIGNERYVAVWEPITDDPSKNEFEQHRLKLPPEYEVIGFAKLEEMLVISAKKTVSSDYGDADWGVDSNEGLLLFWDGTSNTYNWFREITDGAFESIYSAQGLIWGFVNGRLHVSSGDLPIPVKTMTGVDQFNSANDEHDDDVFLQAPYKAMTMHKGVLQMGFPKLSVNDSIIPGVYSYGSLNKDYPESFGLMHIPSHGETAIEYDTTDDPDTPLSGITFVGRFGANMFIAWQHGSSDSQTFGIDVVRERNDPYDTGYVELFEFDDGLPHKEKQATHIQVTWEDLPSGTVVTPKYKIDHEASWNDGTSDGSQQVMTDDKKVVLEINKLFHTIDIRVDITGNSSGSPLIKSVEFVFDDRTDEKL